MFLPIHQEADIALGPFGVSYDRAQVVDFTESLFFDARGLLSSKGVPEIDPWGFLYPLTWLVWAAVAAAVGVVCAATAVLGRQRGGVVSVEWLGGVLFQDVRVFFNQGWSVLSPEREKKKKKHKIMNDGPAL